MGHHSAVACMFQKKYWEYHSRLHHGTRFPPFSIQYIYQMFSDEQTGCNYYRLEYSGIDNIYSTKKSKLIIDSCSIKCLLLIPFLKFTPPPLN